MAVHEQQQENKDRDWSLQQRQLDPRNTLPQLCKCAASICRQAGLWRDLRVSLVNLEEATPLGRPGFKDMVISVLGAAQTIEFLPPAPSFFHMEQFNPWLLQALEAGGAPALRRLTLHHLEPGQLRVGDLPPTLTALALHFRKSKTASLEMMQALKAMPNLEDLDVEVHCPEVTACFGRSAPPRSWPRLLSLTLRVKETQQASGTLGALELEGLPAAAPRLVSLDLHARSIRLPSSLQGMSALESVELVVGRGVVEGLDNLTMSPSLALASRDHIPDMTAVLAARCLRMTCLGIVAGHSAVDWACRMRHLRVLALHLGSNHGLLALFIDLPNLVALQLTCPRTLQLQLPVGLRALDLRDKRASKPVAPWYCRGDLPKGLVALNLLGTNWRWGGAEGQGLNLPHLRLLGVNRETEKGGPMPCANVAHSTYRFWQEAARMPEVQLHSWEVDMLLKF